VLTIIGMAILVALVWVVVSTVVLWRHQERVVFQPPAAWADAPAPARHVSYKAADGHDLFGYLLSPPHPEPARTVVIAFHGNADLAAWTVPWAIELMERTGVTVLIPEYRGYAGIPGSPTYESAAADARGAFAFVHRELHPGSVVLFGHSLGSALATELAAHVAATPDGPAAPRALVLQSPFTSAMEMAARMLVPPIPWLWRRIARVHYDTRRLVATLGCVVHVAHGTRDLNIPSRMGVQVFRAARNRGALLLVNRAGHNDVAEAGGERYWDWLTAAVAPEPVSVR
jgi:fermentation-respiration switch protein FrsA (DUF1100 family)